MNETIENESKQSKPEWNFMREREKKAKIMQKIKRI